MTQATAAPAARRRTKPADKPRSPAGGNDLGPNLGEVAELQRTLNALGVPLKQQEIAGWLQEERDQVVEWATKVGFPGVHMMLPAVLRGKLPAGWRVPTREAPVRDFPDPAPAAGPPVEIPLAKLVPSPTNPRKHFDQEALEKLAGTIRNVGLIQTIVVRRHPEGGDRYEIIAGERRYRAARIAGLKAVRCDVRDLTDEEVLEVQLLENLEREDLNAIEEAESFHALTTRAGFTEEALAKRLGCSQAHVSNRIRLLKLPEVWRQRVISQEIPPTHARYLLPWVDRPAVLDAVEQIAKEWGGFGTVDRFQQIIGNAVHKLSRPLSGWYHRSAPSYWSGDVPLSKKEKEREDLDVVDVPGIGKRAFNVALWDELFEAALKRRSERDAKRAGTTAGAGGKERTPAEESRLREQQAEQAKKKLWTYRVEWAQRQLRDRILALDPQHRADDELLVLKGMIYFTQHRAGHPELDEAAEAAGVKLSGDDDWQAIDSVPDQTSLLKVSQQALAAWVMQTPWGYQTGLPDETLLAMAESFNVDLARDWRVEDAFQALFNKAQLWELVTEWKLAAELQRSSITEGSKRGEIAAAILSSPRAGELRAPKRLLQARRPARMY